MAKPARSRQPNSSSTRAGVRLSIGQVLEQLQGEFPSLTISKLRFLEEQGLVTPNRTPSGYRQFSANDVERLRFVLECQRDKFWPLKVIRERLEELDAQRDLPPGPRAVAEVPHGRLDLEQLATSAGVAPDLVTEVVDLGLIKPGPSNRFDATAIAVVRAVEHLFSLGIDARHLRGFRAAADREAGLIEQIAAPYRATKTSVGQKRAEAKAQEAANACLSLHAALLENLTGN